MDRSSVQGFGWGKAGRFRRCCEFAEPWPTKPPHVPGRETVWLPLVAALQRNFSPSGVQGLDRSIHPPLTAHPFEGPKAFLMRCPNLSAPFWVANPWATRILQKKRRTILQLLKKKTLCCLRQGMSKSRRESAAS